MTTYHSKGIATHIYGGLLVLIACPMIGGGAWLLRLGGSPYHLLLGIALFACSMFTWQRRRAGIQLYAALLLATIVWSLREVGFAPWALMPRLVFLFVIGAWMLTPSFRRSMAPAPATVSRYTSRGTFVFDLAGAVLIGSILHAFHPQAPDPKFQTGMGPFPELRQTVVNHRSADDWPHWGNDRGGPLQPVTTDYAG